MNVFFKMETLALLSIVSLVIASVPGPSGLPMTDYSQLNHDEPTHWTKAATTHVPLTSKLAIKEEIASSISEPSSIIELTTLKTQSTLDLMNENSSQIATTIESNYTISRIEEGTTIGDIENGFHPAFSSMDEAVSISPGNGENTNRGTTSTTAVNSSIYSSYNELAGHLETIKSGERKAEISTTEISTGSLNYDDVDDKPSNTLGEHYYRYDVMDEMKKNYNNLDNELLDKQDMTDIEIDKALTNFKSDIHDPINYDTKPPIIPKYDYNAPDGFDSDQEEEDIRREDNKLMKKFKHPVLPTISDLEENYDVETPFKKWDKDSEEQEKLLENIVFQANNDTLDKIEIEPSDSSDEQTGNGRWFLLLLAGNSTIVRLRQKDFAKYLKLNLAARLSLEYDEVKLNKVVLAPPRLMVNVSVIPSGGGNLDEEFDLNEKLFGEEEAPLNKLAETNATLLELSGEEYHVVRFLSLRSQQPLAMDEAGSETNLVATDRHADIEKVIYFGLGGACLFLIIPLIVALCRLYLNPIELKWPWKRDKLFNGPWVLPRHQRMDEPTAPIGGPLTVIYSGSFVERYGPPSGSWIEDEYQQSNPREQAGLENPVYGFPDLEKSVIYDPVVLGSPKISLEKKLKLLQCRPDHLLIPHTPIKRAEPRSNLDVRITKGLDNPNYHTT